MKAGAMKGTLARAKYCLNVFRPSIRSHDIEGIDGVLITGQGLKGV